MKQYELVLGTRGSALALTQAGLVKSRLEGLGCQIRLEEISTSGDRILDVPLSQIGDKALFTKELDIALLEGMIQLAVHSLKDLPTQLPEGIRIGAVMEREDPHDAFVAHPDFSGGFDALPEGARLGTSSLRRRAQLLAWRPDLDVLPMRGNVDTRLKKLDAGEWQGLILACAGLKRLGLFERIREVVPTNVMLPAVGQGALAIVCAEEDEGTYALLRDRVHDQSTWSAVVAERSLLRTLEGGCSVPVGAHGRVGADGRLELDACVATLDGQRLLRDRRVGRAEDAEALGVALAEDLLNRGAGEILADVRETPT